MTKIVCDACKQRIGVEAFIPSEVWEIIAQGAYALCVPCIDSRLVSYGIECEGILFFRGKALHTLKQKEVEEAIKEFRPSQIQIERDGIVGIPSLSSKAPLWRNYKS